MSRTNLDQTLHTPPRRCPTWVSKSPISKRRHGRLRSGVSSPNGWSGQSLAVAGINGESRGISPLNSGPSDGMQQLTRAQAYIALPTRQRQWPAERHGLRLPRLCQSQDGTGGMARVRAVLLGYFEPYRSDHSDFITYVYTPLLPCFGIRQLSKGGYLEGVIANR